jgi:hypothetical protein
MRTKRTYLDELTAVITLHRVKGINMLAEVSLEIKGGNGI